MNEGIDFKIGLGDKVEDLITGFTGIVICRCQWLHNCNTYGVKSVHLKDGEPGRSVYFDEPQLIIKKENVFKPEQETGGPCEKVIQTNR